MTINLNNQIENTKWGHLNQEDSPFLSYAFFNSLEKSGSIGARSGWNPVYIEGQGENLLYSFIKDHSYGEYIFDWDWANFYHHQNVPYYPKLTSMVPFTSATTPHFIGGPSSELMKEYEEFYLENDFSSSHFLFLTSDELSFFKSFDYILRESFQYHFVNDHYQSFEDFLAKFKNRKARQIKKERKFLDEIQINRYSGSKLKAEHGKEMFKFYLSTISKKQAIPYLNENFFERIFESLKDNICYVQAKRNDRSIAGALYFFCSERLYGRYWGAFEEIPYLHFELCCYQGIEFCIEKKLPVFEAGAQGEHKIARGFRPVKTFSAHKLKNLNFHMAINEYINKEKLHLEHLLPSLNERLPFK